jgi:ribonuclease HI
VDDDHWASGGWSTGTNNMGELMAVIDLLRQTARMPAAESGLLIFCDSQYVINIATVWMAGWKRRGWRKNDNKPILNLDLVQQLDAALHGRKVRFEWVKGHAGHPLNEEADTRARAAATAFRDGYAYEPGPGFGFSVAPGQRDDTIAPASDLSLLALAAEQPPLF